MRKIEKKMCYAVENCINWTEDNTTVTRTSDNKMAVYLFRNHIADVDMCGSVIINYDTLAKWPTRTTKSRLNALKIYFGSVNNATN